MFYGSSHPVAESAGTGWLPGGLTRPSSAYRIFVVCTLDAAQRVDTLVMRGLKARGADVRMAAQPAASKSGALLRLAFTVHGSAQVRGAIAGLVNQLGADPAVRSVRWESDPTA
jgi:hypothetical protein